ncbi:MCE family protein [Candidatus Saganbacteria bacterium]|nr:MCE family protein [Candidatus Saganbacteria bacterium]
MSISGSAKVGVLTIISLIVLGLVAAWKTEIFMVKSGYEMIGSFDNIEGLTVGSEIRYRGFKVGKVLKIDPTPFDIRVYSIIEQNIKFPKDSLLRVAYDGIVGQKYMEIKPGASEALYDQKNILYGVKTSAIVDFVDVGTQNLFESKRILQDIRLMIEDPALRAGITETIQSANRVALEAEHLTSELRQTNKGFQEIVTDPKFQENFKGTIRETEKTLTSANQFFNSTSKLNLRASAGVDVGSKSNAVRGDVDLMRDESNYFRLSLGEGPTRAISLLDIMFTTQPSQRFGYRLGVINNQIGGGIAFFPTTYNAIRGDIYDINNPRPNWPKIRVGYQQEFIDYMDLTLTGDDLLNDGNRNIAFGIKVKAPGNKIF